MFQFFPFSNTHQLNLDWILETISKLPWTVNGQFPDELHNINLPQVSGMSSWNGIGADGAGNVNPLEDIADLDDAAEGLHFYHWEDPDTNNNPYGAAENIGYMTGDGGYVISYVNSSGAGVQIGANAGDYTLATRCKDAGQSWLVWRYIKGTVDISSNLTLNASNIDLDQPYGKYAYIQNDWCFGYVEGVSTGILSGNAKIMDGLPIPLCDPVPYQFTGMIELLPDIELRPCKFQVNSNGELTFSFVGNTEEAGDYICCSFAYPVK